MVGHVLLAVFVKTIVRGSHNIEKTHPKKEEKHFGSFAAYWLGPLAMLFHATKESCWS